MPNIDFPRLACAALNSTDRLIEGRCCPDQYLGPLSEILDQNAFPQRLPAVLRPQGPCIVMVLESPHVAEFIGDPGPAKGFTGEMIRQHLRQALPSVHLETYGLVIVNAIQYQCSLGASTELFRDRVFRAIWRSEGRQDFVQRITRVYRPADIVLNCCTKGNDFLVEVPLRVMVERELRQALPGVKPLRRLHPSAWRKPHFISVEWSSDSPGDERIADQVPSITLPEMQPSILVEPPVDAHGSMASAPSGIAVNQATECQQGHTLEKVRENVPVSGALCTVLVFSDGSLQFMKTSTFDPDGAITAKAKQLLGMPVQTTCWNPRTSPDKWSSRGYFNNIFPA